MIDKKRNPKIIDVINILRGEGEKLSHHHQLLSKV